jgi:adenylate cyclase
MQNQNRQLAAILFTDIIGYTAMMQLDEQKAVAVTRHYITVLSQSVETHHGKVLNDYGDGSLCTFPSVRDAIYCAIEIQQQLQAEPKVPLRIGLHTGEVFFEGNKVMGDSVNIASRIQSLGQANTILFSKEIADKIKNQLDFKCVSLGNFEFKNVDEPMEIFALANDSLKVPKREEMSGKLKEIEKKSARKKMVAAVAFILILAAFFFIYKYLTQSEGFTGEKTIAVLPFENTGIDKSEEYISDAITQDIIQNLSKISSLKKVIGWISIKSFKNTTKSLKQIAEELGVAAVLSGTIQKQGEKSHIGFDYSGKDLLSIQSEVAELIVKKMKASVTPEEKKGLSKHYTENIEAYKLYLRGRAFWSASGPENIDSAEEYYNKAIKLEPDYALAYAGLADCHSVNYRRLPRLQEIPIAKHYVEKALSLDSTLSEALTTLGFIQQSFDYDWTSSTKNLEKAVALDPNNSAARMFYGLALMNSKQDMNKALEELRKAVDLDPLSYYINWNLSRNLYFAGKYDLSIAQFIKMKSIGPQYTLDFSIGLNYLKKQDFKKAEEAFNKLPIGKGTELDHPQIMQAYGYAIIGDTVKAKTLFEETRQKFPNLSHYRTSQVFVALKKFDDGLNELESAYENRDVHLFWIAVDPAFDPIKNEPRFKALLKKMNLD